MYIYISYQDFIDSSPAQHSFRQHKIKFVNDCCAESFVFFVNQLYSNGVLSNIFEYGNTSFHSDRDDFLIDFDKKYSIYFIETERSRFFSFDKSLPNNVIYYEGIYKDISVIDYYNSLVGKYTFKYNFNLYSFDSLEELILNANNKYLSNINFVNQVQIEKTEYGNSIYLICNSSSPFYTYYQDYNNFLNFKPIIKILGG